MTSLAAVALGANIGPREQSLGRAVQMLDEYEPFEILSVSSLYESPPWGDTDQPDFLNAVVVGHVDGSARDLLEYLKSCEASIGKATVRRWGPRVIDLDLLAVGDEVSADPVLELPHPRMAGRPFVYLPLREACAGLTLPDSWQTHLDANDEGRALEGVTQRRRAEDLFPSRPVTLEVTLILDSESETEWLARTMARGCRGGEVFALSGPLGAGKSVFVRALAHELGIEGPLPSPTYTLCREYRSGRLSLQHWDFYRLESEDDLESAGFPPARGEFDILAIEWADRFADAIPPGRLTRIELAPLPGRDYQRRVTIKFPRGSVAMRASLGMKGQGPC